MYSTQRTPIAGSWYINKTGQLFKVKLIGYTGSDVKSITLEYLNGLSKKISVEDWNYLELSTPGARYKATENLST